MKTPQTTDHRPQYLNAKFLLLFSIFVLIRIAIFAQNCSTAIPINFDYDPYNEQVPINLENFGYNTYSLYNKAVSAENTNSANDHYANCTDQYNPKTEFLNIWDELPGNMMRFPGGTASQLYHSGFTNYSYPVIPALSAPFYPLSTACPFTYTVPNTNPPTNTNNNLFKGYGVKRKSGIGGEKLPNSPDFDDSEGSIWRFLFNEFDAPRKRNIIYDFIELIKAKENRQGGKKVEVLFVFNIMTHLFDHSINANQNNKILDLKAVKLDATAPKHAQFVSEMNENLNTLRFLLNNDIKVVGVEMGNELTHDRYAELKLSPKEYIEIVRQYAEILRTQTEFNGIKIGVVGEVSLADNAILTSTDCNENIEQTAIGPLLLSTTYNLCWDIQLSKNSTFVKNSMTYPLFDAFIIHKYFDNTYPDIYKVNNDKSFAYFIQNLENLRTIYLNFPQNNIQKYKIWFTEWNQDPPRIDQTIKSENTRYIYDVYSYLTQYNALNNNLFEYTTFHNFLGASKISLIYSIPNSVEYEQRDNIKAHYLMNKIENGINEIQLLKKTTSKNTSTMIAKPNDCKFLDVNVGENKFWLRDFCYLTNPNEPPTLGSKNSPTPTEYCNLFKTVYFLFNNSTSNSYCLNPLFINPNFLAQVAPQQLLGSAASPEIYAYTEDMVSGEFNITPISTSGNNIPPKSIGYVKYNYEFYPIDCKYYGSRLAQKIEDGKTNNTLYVYPNPAQNKLFIEGFRYEKEGIVNIFDAQGKISNYKIRNNEIDISNLANGIYFLSIENEGAIFHQKLVIQK